MGAILGWGLRILGWAPRKLVEAGGTTRKLQKTFVDKDRTRTDWSRTSAAEPGTEAIANGHRWDRENVHGSYISEKDYSYEVISPSSSDWITWSQRARVNWIRCLRRRSPSLPPPARFQDLGNLYCKWASRFGCYYQKENPRFKRLPIWSLSEISVRTSCSCSVCALNEDEPELVGLSQFTTVCAWIGCFGGIQISYRVV